MQTRGTFFFIIFIASVSSAQSLYVPPYATICSEIYGHYIFAGTNVKHCTVIVLAVFNPANRLALIAHKVAW